MTSPKIDPRLSAALAELAVDVHLARDPWWLIGSAAMALHGAGPLHIADIDLLTSVADAHRLLQARGVSPETGTASGRFRSEVHASWPAPPLQVDLMARFHVRSASGWREVLPSARVAVNTPSGVFYVPALSDLIEMCRLFDRPKDHERRRLLEELLA